MGGSLVSKCPSTKNDEYWGHNLPLCHMRSENMDAWLFGIYLGFYYPAILLWYIREYYAISPPEDPYRPTRTSK